MKGIEFTANELKFYHSNNSDFSNVFTECLIDKKIKLSIDDKDIIDILEKLNFKINKCLSDEKYLKTDREKTNRLKKVTFNSLDYELNLSNSNHFHFYELVTLYNSILDLNKDSIFNISFK